MSLELFGSVQQLVSVLRRNFKPVGQPPHSPLWSYQVISRKEPREQRGAKLGEMHERQFNDCEKPEVFKFSALIREDKHRLITEALNHIPPLADVAEALLHAKKWIDSERRDPAAARCCHLFEELCESAWFKQSNGSPQFVAGHSVRWGYRLRHIEDRFLLDLTEAAYQTIDSNINKALSLDEDEKEIISLLTEVGRRLTTQQVLAEFEKRGRIKSEGTTKQKLSALCVKGSINNRADVQPRGYGLGDCCRMNNLLLRGEPFVERRHLVSVFLKHYFEVDLLRSFEGSYEGRCRRVP